MQTYKYREGYDVGPAAHTDIQIGFNFPHDPIYGISETIFKQLTSLSNQSQTISNSNQVTIQELKQHLQN